MDKKEEALLVPDTPNGRAKTGTRRVNNRPLLIGGAVLLAFFLTMAWVAYERSQEPPQQADANKKIGSTKNFAEEIAGSHTGGLIPPDVPKLPEAPEVPTATTPTASVPIASPTVSLDTPPIPTRLERSPHEDDLMRIRQAKIQMLEQGIRSKTGVQAAELRNRPAAITQGPITDRDSMLSRIAETRQQIAAVHREDPTAAYQARLEQLRGSGILPTGDGGSSFNAPPSQLLASSQGASAGRNDYARYDSVQGKDRWLLEKSEQERPRTPYELKAGFVVPAVMISGVNSDLPGQVIAQVSQSVYDTATGKYLVIPQGTRLIGTYNNDVAYGQERVMIAWQRLVYPDGKTLDLGAMPGADAAGYSGFSDQVNNHYFRTFTSAFLMSGVVAGINLSQNRSGDSNSNSQRSSDALSEALGQQLGTVMAQMIMKNLNVAPTLEIRPGYRFNVMVTKDIPFSRPYSGFDY